MASERRFSRYIPILRIASIGTLDYLTILIPYYNFYNETRSKGNRVFLSGVKRKIGMYRENRYPTKHTSPRTLSSCKILREAFTYEQALSTIREANNLLFLLILQKNFTDDIVGTGAPLCAFTSVNSVHRLAFSAVNKKKATSFEAASLSTKR